MDPSWQSVITVQVIKDAVFCGQTTNGWTTQSTKHLQQKMEDFIEEAQRWELVVVEYRRRGDQGGHDGGNRKRTAQFLLEKQLQDSGILFM